jgi:MFS family permease
MPSDLAATPAKAAWYSDLPPHAWRVLLFAGMGWMFDVYDSFVLSLTLPALVAAFALSKAEAGSIGSILAGGLIVGGIVMGGVADRIGRVKALYASILVYSVFTAATALMQMGLPFGSVLAIGVTALVAHLMGGLDGIGWRVIYALGALPAVIMLPIALRTPESPVWRNRSAEAQQRVSFLELFRGPNARGMLLAFAFIFFVQYVYWGVFTWTPTFLVSVKHLEFVHGLAFVLIQQAGSLAGFLVFAALVDRFGRRPTFILYLLIGAIAVGFLVSKSTPGVLMATMFFTGFGIAGIFAGMGPFTAEMVANTTSRGLAMGIAYNGGRLGGLVAPVLIGALATSESGFALGMATTIGAFLLAIGVILLCPETRGTEIG